MKSVQKVVANNDFLLFLYSKQIYTNKPIYYENLLLWISKASNGLLHYKQTT
jgi:hypothetical protein